jgi:hypothetical protein
MNRKEYNFNNVGDNEIASMMDEMATFHENAVGSEEFLALTEKEIALIRKCAERLRRARSQRLPTLVFNNIHKRD